MANLGIDYAATDNIKTPGLAGFTKARQAGARMIIPRAIYGGMNAPARDPYWARDKEAIVVAGLNRSAYMFLTVPNKNDGNVPTPAQQAKALIDYVGSDLGPPTLGKRHQSMVPFIDVEMESTLSAEAYYQAVLQAVLVLRTYYGAWPGIYTSERVWTEHLRNHAAGQLIHCPLWIAKPWPVPPGAPAIMSGAPSLRPITIPEFGDSTNWLLYQYQGDALGMPGMGPEYVDMNRVNVVRQGAKGSIVRWIQARLGELVVDGDFGTLTTARLKEIQAAYAITPDGVFGSDSATLLSWLNPAPM